VLLDSIIDSCAVMVHLRTCIDETLHKLKPEVSVLLKESRAKELKEKGLWALQRYFMLLACATYLYERSKRLQSAKPQPNSGSGSGSGSGSAFAQWFSSRKELESMYRALVFPF
jgi:hypothetical protein